MSKGMTRKCPQCGAVLAGLSTDWVLTETTIAGHRVCTIGSQNAPAAAAAQMAANLAAYTLDYDVRLNLGFRGTAWVQCPTVREVTDICSPT